MNPQLLLFAGAVVGTVGVLHIVLKPRAFRIVLMGAGLGMAGAAFITYTNSSRHAMPSSFVPITLKPVPIDFSKIQPVIYENLTLNYNENDTANLNKGKGSENSKKPTQPKNLDVDEVRHMWISAVLPVFRSYSNKERITATESVENVERGIVFCEMGSELGSICLQVLMETKCTKTVGIEGNSKLMQTAKEATKRAQELYPETLNGKESIWYEDDFSNSSDILKKEAVNIILIRSNALDKIRMEKLASFADSVPCVKCIITLQKIDSNFLRGTSFVQTSLLHSSPNWDKGSLFYVYQRQ